MSQMSRFRHPATARASIAGASVAALCMTLAPAVSAAPSGQRLHRAVNHHYVTDKLILLTDASSKRTGFDLDNDADHAVDNQLASIFGALTSDGIDLRSTVESSVTSGDVVMLHSLRSASLTNAKGATWRVFAGKPKASPVLTGGGRFRVDPAVAAGKAMIGRIKNGTFLGAGGSIPLQLAMVPDQPPVELRLVAARLKAHCDATGCTRAKFGGGIPKQQVNRRMIPALAALLQNIVDTQCPPPHSTCSSEAQQILATFDTNSDYVITVHEVRSNNFVQVLFAPDLDLYKANGKPGTDGVMDSLSAGIGFRAKSAHFSQP
jgi:hypothetical protein